MRLVGAVERVGRSEAERSCRPEQVHQLFLVPVDIALHHLNEIGGGFNRFDSTTTRRQLHQSYSTNDRLNRIHFQLLHLQSKQQHLRVIEGHTSTQGPIRRSKALTSRTASFTSPSAHTEHARGCFVMSASSPNRPPVPICVTSFSAPFCNALRHECAMLEIV